MHTLYDANSILYFLFKNISEWVYFLIVIVVLFNMFTDFTYKTGIVRGILTIGELQYYGFLSVMLAINNFMSKKFFGLEIFRT